MTKPDRKSRRWYSPFRRHIDDQSGSFSIEAILALPFLLFGYIGMYTMFEGLRENNINLKASYTVGDLLSRETDLVDMTYLNGVNSVFAWLTRTQSDVSIRVTVVRYDAALDQHILVWSRGVNGRTDLIQDTVDAFVTPHIPILADADTAIIVETWSQFDPIMDIGMQSTELYNIVVTAPRFTEQLGFVGINDGTGSEHNDGTDDDQSI
ncbi:MAG: hypothetical protein OXQ92_06160 [Boseongicola sp.]|nr:hypothetical protein [Boseongicola sp.]MDD9979005.1 hypothetical protein [Boseongicola sp.]